MNTFRANVNKKYCSYYECGNNSISNPTVTFFAFPKQPNRCEIWLKAAGVPDHLVEDRMHRFLCERHFANIYICRSQRRTLLLANAVPYAFNEPVDMSENDGEELEIMDDIAEDTTVDSGDMLEAFRDGQDSMDDLQVTEHVIIDANKSARVDREEATNEPVTLNTEPATYRMQYHRKRKAVATKIAEMKAKLSTVQNTAVGSPATLIKDTNIKTIKLDRNTMRLVPVPKMVRLTPIVPEKGSNTENPGKEVIRASLKSPVSSSTNAIEIIEQNEDTSTSKSSDDTVLEKDDKISEFIFKGEEYVQMPKEHYLKKINGLKRSLAFYENIVRNMREVLDQADPTSTLDC